MNRLQFVAIIALVLVIFFSPISQYLGEDASSLFHIVSELFCENALTRAEVQWKISLCYLIVLSLFTALFTRYQFLKGFSEQGYYLFVVAVTIFILFPFYEISLDADVSAEILDLPIGSTYIPTILVLTVSMIVLGRLFVFIEKKANRIQEEDTPIQRVQNDKKIYASGRLSYEEFKVLSLRIGVKQMLWIFPIPLIYLIVITGFLIVEGRVELGLLIPIGLFLLIAIIYLITRKMTYEKFNHHNYFEFDNLGMIIQNKKGEMNLKWEEIKKVEEWRDYVILYSKNKLVFTLKNSFFNSEEELNSFKEYIPKYTLVKGYFS